MFNNSHQLYCLLDLFEKYLLQKSNVRIPSNLVCITADNYNYNWRYLTVYLLYKKYIKNTILFNALKKVIQLILDKSLIVFCNNV